MICHVSTMLGSLMSEKSAVVLLLCVEKLAHILMHPYIRLPEME